MRVNDKDYRTVWMKKSTVFMIQQNLLPFKFSIYEAANCKQTCKAIKTMIIRGAGAIGAAAAFAIAQGFIEAQAQNDPNYIKQCKEMIENTRPTARNLFYAVDMVYNRAADSENPVETAIKTAQYVADKDASDSRTIGELGNGLIKSGCRILTHCNAGWLAFVDHGTALSPIYRAAEADKNVFVYVDETRPRSQGARLTAWELKQAGIEHKIIPDNAAAHYMSKGLIDMVITGADRIAANGDTANKIGTLEKAIAAKFYNIPFYIAAPTSTIDIKTPGADEIIIEERSENEVLYMDGIDKNGKHIDIRVCSPGSSALNPAFDVTPAKLIKGIITEKGIINPDVDSIKKIIG